VALWQKDLTTPKSGQFYYFKSNRAFLLRLVQG